MELKLDDKLTKELREEGYGILREIPKRGICGVYRFAFTTSLVYGIDRTGYIGRYCYPTFQDAVTGFVTWNGEGDPEGPWIKHKEGIGEYSNPNKT